MRKVWLGLSIGWLIPLVTLATWAEPSCDPSDDPTLCNIAAPINVSSTDQTKSGGLTIGGTLTANGSSIFASSGSITADGSVLVRGSLTIQNTTIFSNPYSVTVNGPFNYTDAASSFTLTNDSIDDNEVSDTLTASIFVASGSTSSLVDLSSEVNTTGEAWVNTTGDTMIGTLTIAPTTAVDALSIVPSSTQEAIYITGTSGQPLVSLNPTGSTGQALRVAMTTGSARGIQVTTSATSTGQGIYVSSTTSGYPIYATATTASRTIYATNSTTNGYAIQGVATGTTSVGVGGSGTSYGVYGVSSTGVGVYGGSGSSTAGYLSSGTTAGTGVYIALTSTATTSASKALEVVGKNGYGGYFTTDGNESTALYAENTNTVAGFDKYGIQTSVTTPAGVGIAATSDYGVAGQFNSAAAGGVALETNVDDFGTALDANGGIIADVLGYRGGQFYPNEQPSTAVFSNEKIQIIQSESLNGNATDMFFDGDSLWTANNYSVMGTPYAKYSQHSLRDGHDIYYTTIWSADSLEINMAGDTMYFFTDSADYYTKNRIDGSESSSSLSSSITINSSAFDGEDMWFGTTSRIYQWDGLTTLTSRASGLGSIADMVYADGYLWAADSSNDVVYKMDVSTYTSSSITVGDNPQALVYDGQSLWVANYGGDSLTRINVADSSTTSYSVSSAGTGPQALTFDGANIWIGFDNTDGIAAFNVAQESIIKSDQLLGTSVSKLAFDGTYIWASTESASLLQIASGTGFGGNSESIMDGILMYNTSGSVRCLYISGTTVTASATLTNCQ